MKEIFYLNETNKTQFIGGVAIPPGESRKVPAYLLPGIDVPVDEVKKDPEEVFSVEKLLSLNLRSLEAALEKGFSPEQGFSKEQLEALKKAELDGDNRKGAIEALDAELLKLAGSK